MFLITTASLVSAISFVACTFTALFFTLIGDIGTSIGFALIAGIWFVLMVTFGYAYLNWRR